MGPEQVELLIIGLAAGLLGGLLGIGGSIIMIPAMIFLISDPNQHLFQGAAMIVNFFVIMPSVYAHAKADAILTPVIRMTIPAAIAGVLIGVWLSGRSWFAGGNEVYLSRLFGCFLLYGALYNIVRLVTNVQLPDINREQAGSLSKFRIVTAVGLPMGLIGGLLGVGGGVLAVPAQQLFLRMPIRRAIANSATTILALSVIGAISKNVMNAQTGLSIPRTLSLVGFLAPAAMLGGYFGGRLTHLLPRRVLRVAVILLMCFGGTMMLLRNSKGAPPSPETQVAVLSDSSTSG